MCKKSVGRTNRRRQTRGVEKGKKDDLPPINDNWINWVNPNETIKTGQGGDDGASSSPQGELAKSE